MFVSLMTLAIVWVCSWLMEQLADCFRKGSKERDNYFFLN